MLNQPAPSTERHTPSAAEFKACQQSPEFQELRSKQRGFTFPLTIAGLVWFMLYVVIAMYAPGVLNKPVFGNINVGILMGVSQFVTTFGITWMYVSYANKNLEPRSQAIRESLEHPSANPPSTTVA
ncbi:DUF485 domain-containing protein [Corynebacterium sp. zg254]|uniref:DUF485 domain-containing protein n=1 Tax=Corynebacterium zhongnanshanii TaxID=2768834 RepID=A0ABQ6VH95_9CORY|nr:MULTISPECIES: DUF485 domain-containing protein [Corynebacterium]KAB1551481.1 DUF485 domain-containing protein [Corynebacterium sp. 321]KAB3521024.1 DUF485 domain-containing protein [Corynebacterium zhongnanshanii]MCR5914666.1 DUF485 domain-containing protein [Corynebacterium sp. zg254]